MNLSTLKSHYKDLWILAKIKRTGKNQQIQEVEPLAASKSRGYVIKRARELAPKHFTILYTGKLKKLPRL